MRNFRIVHFLIIKLRGANNHKSAHIRYDIHGIIRKVIQQTKVSIFIEDTLFYEGREL